MKKPLMRTCGRGHSFEKRSDCPTCPICWPGYYKKKAQEKIPADIPAPALRALLNNGITSLANLSTYSEQEILELHGMGPSSIPKLRSALKAKGLSFKKA